jgi:hypothetical protein
MQEVGCAQCCRKSLYGRRTTRCRGA